MKKIFITMLAAVAATASFAQGNPKIEKEVKATKEYNAGKTLLEGQYASLTDEQKGAGHNALVEIVYPNASKAFDTWQINSTMGKNDPVDFQPIYQAIDEAVKADELNAKFHKKNQDRLANFRIPLIVAGQNYLQVNDYDNAFEYMKLYVTSGFSSLFKEVAGEKDANIGNVARLCCAIMYQKENYAEGIKYGEIAMADTASRADAEPYYFACIEKQLKTKDDTLKYIKKMEEIDAKKYFARMMSLYNSIGETELANKLLDEEIARNPQNKMAYAVKGENAMQNREYDVAIANFKKVVELDPSFTAVWFNLGVCTSQKGFDLNEKYTDSKGKMPADKAAEVQGVLKEAIVAYEKVRELDPNHEQISNWPVQLRMLYNAVGETAKAQEITNMLGDN